MEIQYIKINRMSITTNQGGIVQGKYILGYLKVFFLKRKKTKYKIKQEAKELCENKYIARY